MADPDTEPQVAAASTGVDTDVADHDDDDVVVLSWWQHPVNVIALVVAVALMGGMVGWLIGDDRHAERGNDVDVGFLQDMRVHHEQAAQMSFIYLGLEDTSPGLRTVAGGILVGQNIEIGRMIQMLRDMGRAEANETGQAMGWMGMPVPEDEMPGMATDEQLAALAASSGAEADELFVELMTAHHESGIHMAEYAREHASLEKVRSFAESIIEGQRGEIAEMEQLLAG
jgi:uncharacterized protein (DUF305 family)